jgi:hypothetical protein
LDLQLEHGTYYFSTQGNALSVISFGFEDSLLLFLAKKLLTDIAEGEYVSLLWSIVQALPLEISMASKFLQTRFLEFFTKKSCQAPKKTFEVRTLLSTLLH